MLTVVINGIITTKTKSLLQVTKHTGGTEKIINKLLRTRMVGVVVFFFSSLCLFKIKYNAIDAIAKTGRCRTILEDVPEMSATVGAQDFGAPHAVAFVQDRGDCAVERGEKTWPAGATVELGR